MNTCVCCSGDGHPNVGCLVARVVGRSGFHEVLRERTTPNGMHDDIHYDCRHPPTHTL